MIMESEDGNVADSIVMAVALGIQSYSRCHHKRVMMPEVLAEYVADHMAAEIGFDREKFIKACTPKGQ